ncbi:MAG: methylmalonyl-CoA mutase, partial [Anaerolineae bacterium]|nr:methylmalonyl-CoA mutase [Anaerolineae bacterium]
FVNDEPINIPILDMNPQGYEEQCARLDDVRRSRDNEAVTRCLDDLRQAAQGTENMMPFILDAVKAYATLQEIMDVLRDVFGEYQEMTII